MPMLEGQVDAVVGVDTHRDRHAAALLRRALGYDQVLSDAEVELLAATVRMRLRPAA